MADRDVNKPTGVWGVGAGRPSLAQRVVVATRSHDLPVNPATKTNSQQNSNFPKFSREKRGLNYSNFGIHYPLIFECWHLSYSYRACYNKPLGLYKDLPASAISVLLFSRVALRGKFPYGWLDLFSCTADESQNNNNNNRNVSRFGEHSLSQWMVNGKEISHKAKWRFYIQPSGAYFGLLLREKVHSFIRNLSSHMALKVS